MKQVVYREPYSGDSHVPLNMPVRVALDHRMYRRQLADGQLELIEEKIDNVGRAFCQLIEVLHSSGTISDEILLKLLGEGYTLVDQ